MAISSINFVDYLRKLPRLEDLYMKQTYPRDGAWMDIFRGLQTLHLKTLGLERLPENIHDDSAKQPDECSVYDWLDTRTEQWIVDGVDCLPHPIYIGEFSGFWYTSHGLLDPVD